MAAYGTDQGFLDYMAAQGLTLPVGSPDIEVLRTLGSNYIDAAYEWRLSCSRRSGGFAQELAWPRTSHWINGQLVPDDLMPAAWVNASYRAGYLNAVTPGWSTASVDSARQTKREKVDVIEREFFSAKEVAGSDAAPGMASDAVINGMVSPWLCSNVRSASSLFRVI